MIRLAVRALALLLALPAVASARRDVEVQLLALNDFHGHLETTTPGTIKPFDTGSSSDRAVAAGGAEYLATHVRKLEPASATRCSSRPATWSAAARWSRRCSTTSRRSRR